MPTEPFHAGRKLIGRPVAAQVDRQLTGERRAVHAGLDPLQVHARHVPHQARTGSFQVGSREQQIVDLQGAFHRPLLQPLGHRRCSSQSTGDQPAAAAKRRHQRGFERDGIHRLGPQADAVRTRHGGFIAVLTGEFHLADLRFDAVQHHTCAIDLRARRGHQQRIGKTGNIEARIGQFQAAGPSRHIFAVPVP